MLREGLAADNSETTWCILLDPWYVRGAPCLALFKAQKESYGTLSVKDAPLNMFCGRWIQFEEHLFFLMEHVLKKDLCAKEHAFLPLLSSGRMEVSLRPKKSEQNDLPLVKMLPNTVSKRSTGLPNVARDPSLNPFGQGLQATWA